jgi:hypothetical protein
VLVRANDDTVRIIIGTKTIAEHRRSWGVGEDIELPEHRSEAIEQKRRPNALPPGLEALGELGRKYLKVFSASSRSIQREVVRLVFLVELFGAAATLGAMEEVMRSGHVGAEYVEYILRHKRGLVPAPAPLRLGSPDLDQLSLGEPDMAVYDELFKPRPTRASETDEAAT